MDSGIKDETVQAYLHKVQYYETDGMGIVHHSNYIRWMEESRLDYLHRVGLDYEMLEERGLVIPVLEVSCKYRISVPYGETVKIFMTPERFTGVKFSATYRITDMEEKVLHATGRTEHCFLTKDLKPVNIKKAAPDIYEFFSRYKSDRPEMRR